MNLSVTCWEHRNNRVQEKIYFRGGKRKGVMLGLGLKANIFGLDFDAQGHGYLKAVWYVIFFDGYL